MILLLFPLTTVMLQSDILICYRACAQLFNFSLFDLNPAILIVVLIS
jgi:hypothetical protein